SVPTEDRSKDRSVGKFSGSRHDTSLNIASLTPHHRISGSNRLKLRATVPSISGCFHGCCPPRSVPPARRRKWVWALALCPGEYWVRNLCVLPILRGRSPNARNPCPECCHSC